MDSIHYLTSIINILQKKPEVQRIIDTQGLGQELTFGQIGIRDIGAFLRLYDVLNSIEGVETTTVREVMYDGNKQYAFRLVSPITLYFFHCEGVSE
jgi:hypothetical protein